MNFREDWERCAPWLGAALEFSLGTHTLDDVLVEVGQGKAHFWPFERCAVVSQFIDYPRLRAMAFWLAGGDLDQLMDVRPALEQWGREHGVTRFIAPGRPGWSRALRSAGYAPAYTITLKDDPA